MLSKIRSDYHGGNIILDKQIGNKIYLRQDQGKTQEHWFYYNFMVEEAVEGRFIFKFTDGDVVGPAGPAISHDGIAWTFLLDRIDNTSFEYTFSSGENVYFAFCPYYGLVHMDRFLEQNPQIIQTTLCRSLKGRGVPLLTMGNKDKPTIIFTSRHHSCESPGTYALLGALGKLARDDHFLANYSLIAIPFMDMDGVVDGDQGKAREPHDHNRDYKQLIYPEVAALQTLAKQNDVVMYIDFHAPWYYGDRNDTVFMVYGAKPQCNAQVKFGKILSDVHDKKNCPLFYDNDNNLMFGKEWNLPLQDDSMQTSANWFNEQGVPLAFTLEVTYTGMEYGSATPENLEIMGESVGEAVKKYLLSVHNQFL